MKCTNNSRELASTFCHCLVCYLHIFNLKIQQKCHFVQSHWLTRALCLSLPRFCFKVQWGLCLLFGGHIPAIQTLSVVLNRREGYTVFLSVPSKVVMALISFWCHIIFRSWSAPSLALLYSSPCKDAWGKGVGRAPVFKVEQPEHDNSPLCHLY